MTYAEAQPLAHALATKLQSLTRLQPGTKVRDPASSHPLTCRAIRLSEQLASVRRRGYGDTGLAADMSDELEAIANQMHAEGIE